MCLSVCLCVCLCLCVCVCASSRALWRHPSAGTCRLIKGSASPARLWMKVGSVPANLFLLLAAEFVVLLVGVFAILSVLRGHLRPHAAHHNVWVGVGGCGWAWVYVWVYTYIHTTNIHTHTHTYVHAYIHTHTYMLHTRNGTFPHLEKRVALVNAAASLATRGQRSRMPCGKAAPPIHR